MLNSDSMDPSIAFDQFFAHQKNNQFRKTRQEKSAHCVNPIVL